MAVKAYHIIFCTYGFWLPNDPRGSWSDFVRNWELVKYGKATKINTRKSVACQKHDYTLRMNAKRALKYKPFVLTGKQALIAAKGFAEAKDESDYNVYACSILPDHIHMVIDRHKRRIEFVIRHFKTRATQALKRSDLLKDDYTSFWARSAWKVYLNSENEIRSAISYVKNNPIKEGKRKQSWSFVDQYEQSV